MARVELVYHSDCPQVPAARSELQRALSAGGMRARWQEWQGDDPEAPPHVRGYGSPTILVDGRDVAEVDEPGGPSCRLYRRQDGSVAGVPSAEMIAVALRSSAGGAAAGSSAGGWKLGLATVPGIGAALLPKVACPACWPAYTGFASSIGVGFLLDSTYLLPLTAMFLAFATGALGYRASRRRGYRPFLLGLVGAVIVLVGKFFFASNPGMYSGLAFLVTASLWNSWPRRTAELPCPSCVGTDAMHQPQP